MDQENTESTNGTRRLVSKAAFAVLILVLSGVGAYFFLPVREHGADFIIERTPTPSVSENSAYVLSRSEPSRLRIPALSLEAPFTEPLGLKDNDEVEVPVGFEEVGWYKYGPAPGSLGPAVVLGHVDSKEGPAVFYPLGQLKEGDSIFIDRADGSVAEFIVTELERTPQAAFPTEKVYGNIDHAGLRLVTCTGIYNKGELRYSHNLVVYARLKEPM